MSGLTEKELIAGYALPPARPAREELLRVLQECIERKAVQARGDMPESARAVLIGWRSGVEWALREVEYLLPRIIEQASEWDVKKALMDVAQYEDSLP